MNKIFNFQAELKEKIQLTETIFKLKYSVPTEFYFKPGQFVGIRVIPTHTRAYSIVDLNNGLLELLVDVKPDGIASKFFLKTEVGENVQMLGPYGIYGIKSELPNKVFISTGTGIAPFIPMIKSLDLNQTNVSFLFGVREDAHDIAYNYIKDSINERFKYYQCITREEPAHEYSFRGRVTEVLPIVVSGFSNSISEYEFYICGANEMISDVVTLLKGLGADKIYFEKYG